MTGSKGRLLHLSYPETSSKTTGTRGRIPTMTDKTLITRLFYISIASRKTLENEGYPSPPVGAPEVNAVYDSSNPYDR